MEPEQEKKIIELARTDINAFGNLYDEYYPKIFGYILTRTAGVHTAQDITSNVFFKAMNRLHRFRWRNIPFSAWLYRIANNEIANYYRKNGYEQTFQDDIPDSISISEQSPENELLAAEEEMKKYEDFLLLQKNIEKLSLKYQEVITLRFFENRKINEIGEILGKREGTVKSLLHRGLKKLRKSMEENATIQ